MASSQPVTFITNANELTAKLGAMGEQVENPQEVLQQARRLIQQQEAEVWATDGAALEETWKALRDPERSMSGHILESSGALKDSMSDYAAGAIRGATLRFHPKPYYGRFHQFGTGGAHPMDARPFSGISESTYREILRLFQEAANADLGV
jgi:phage gpG-like protein